MRTRRIETQLDEATIRELDGWRAELTPPPSRSEAVRLLLEERLSGDRYRKPAERRGPGVCPGVDRLGALYVLERVSGFGPGKFRAMHNAGVDPQAAIKNPDLLPFTGRTGEKLRHEIASLSKANVAAGRERAVDQLERAREHSASILTHGDPGYPERVYVSNNPVPVLYVRGDPAVWDGTGTVAVVGSRNTRGTLRERRSNVRCIGGKAGNRCRLGVRDGCRLDGAPSGRGGQRSHGVRHAMRAG